MVRFDKEKNLLYTSKRPFHRVAIAYCCSRNTAKKYIGWAVAVTRCIDNGKLYNGWICFEDYRDFRTWKRQQKKQRW